MGARALGQSREQLGLLSMQHVLKTHDLVGMTREVFPPEERCLALRMLPYLFVEETNRKTKELTSF